MMSRTTKRRSAFGCLLLLALSGGVPSQGAGPVDTVGLARADLNGDGAAELILRNRYLEVEVMTGEEPRATSAPSAWQRLWGRKPVPRKPTYGTRFVGPGWIRNVTFRPTGRRWFMNDVRPGGSWHGIPEEFDQAVRMAEIEPGVWHCLKIGIGVCRGTGWCTRGTLSLIDPGVWRMVIEDPGDGAIALVFTQTVDTDYGYAYTYTKRIELRPGQSRFLTTRTLRNRGRQPLRTTWYTHGFWGQADSGNTYDETCWVTIPIQSLVDGRNGPLNTDPCIVSKRHPAYYWGAIDGRAVGGPWYACGQSVSREFFVNSFSRTPDYYRVWSHTDTYSCEPFQVIDLAPGQEVTWHDMRGCGQGLPRVDGQDGLAAYALSRVTTDEDVKERLVIHGVSFSALEQARLTVDAVLRNGERRSRAVELGPLSPQEPFSVMLEHAPDEISRVHADLTGIGAAIEVADAGPAILSVGRRWETDWPRLEGEQLAVIFAELERDTSGALVPSRAVSYLTDYLLKAGFAVKLARPGDHWESIDWEHAKVVVFSGMGGLSQAKVVALERFVDSGGGLLVCGPLPPRPLEFSRLLPVKTVVANISVGLSPRDCTREFMGASDTRYHLRAHESHPVMEGLPLFPHAYQDVARLQVVEPRDDATVVLSYATPSGMGLVADAPALLTAERGQGRVAVLTCPVDWGHPASWCIWSRLGEYHRKLFVQTVLWLNQ